MGGLADELYSHKGLETVLDEFFGNEPLGAGLTHTLITSYDIQNRQSVSFKSWRRCLAACLTGPRMPPTTR